MGFKVRVQGLEVWYSGCRVWGLEVGVSGFGSMVWGWGIRV